MTLWTRVFMILVVVLLAVVAFEIWILIRWFGQLGNNTGWTIFPPIGG